MPKTRDTAFLRTKLRNCVCCDICSSYCDLRVDFLPLLVLKMYCVHCTVHILILILVLFNCNTEIQIVH